MRYSTIVPWLSTRTCKKLMKPSPRAVPIAGILSMKPSTAARNVWTPSAPEVDKFAIASTSLAIPSVARPTPIPIIRMAPPRARRPTAANSATYPTATRAASPRAMMAIPLPAGAQSISPSILITGARRASAATVTKRPAAPARLPPPMELIPTRTASAADIMTRPLR